MILIMAGATLKLSLPQKGASDLWRVAEGHCGDECITAAAAITHVQRPWPRRHNDKDAEKRGSR